MNRYRGRLCMSLLLALGAAPAIRAAQTQEPVITISTSPSDVKLGQPVELHVVLSNPTRHAFSIFKSPGGINGEVHYYVKVTGPGGGAASLTHYGEAIRNKQVMTIARIRYTVNPGESVEETINASHMFKFDVVGEYRIQVQRESPLDSKTTLKSNVLVVTITN